LTVHRPEGAPTRGRWRSGNFERLFDGLDWDARVQRLQRVESGGAIFCAYLDSRPKRSGHPCKRSESWRDMDPGLSALGRSEEEKAKIKAGLLAATPLGRLGDPDETAKAITFLASDDSS